VSTVPVVPYDLGVARDVTVRVSSSWDDLQAHAADWERLLACTPAATIFMTPEWLGAWWRAFTPDGTLHGLWFVDAQGEVVGLAPLYVDAIEGPWAIRLLRLRLLGDGSHDSDNLDLLVRPGYEAACARAFLSWFEHRSGCAVAELNTLPPESPSARCLRAVFARGRFTHTLHTRPRLVVSLPPTWDEYTRQLSAKERGKIRYLTRRLERTHRLEIRKCVEADRLSDDLGALFELHQKRWTERGAPGTFAGPARRAFYLDVARSFLDRGWLEFWLLELDGRPAAAQFAFRYGDITYTLQEGFDPHCAAESVGYVLRAHVLRQLIESGVRRYDFLGGTDPSKERWSSQTASYTDLHFARTGTAGSVYLRTRQAGETAKAWMRSNLRPGQLAAVRAAYGWLRDGMVGQAR
jgi:CelD/BcsL family acetyltransferase involved in cellulose biosynthesis